MSAEKTERNKLAVALIKKKWSYDQVRKELGLKSRSTVHAIVKRHLERNDISSFSTRKLVK